MRTVLLLVILAVASAGCTNSGEETPATPTNATTPTLPPPPPPEPKEVKSESHDFSQGALVGTPAGGAAETAITIDPGYTNLTLNVTFTPAGVAPAGLAQGISVKVGALTCALPDGPLTAPVTCTQSGVATAGPSKITYAGAGPVTAAVKVIES